MIKATAFIGLGLCIIFLSGCSPKIDGSSAKAYESSLIKVASGLDTEKRQIFKVATDIVISRSPSLPNLDEVANARVAISGKSADEVINEATELAKKEYLAYSKAKSESDRAREQEKQQRNADRKILDLLRIKVSKIDRSTTMERYQVENGSEEYDRLGDEAWLNPLSRWRSRVASESYVATVTFTNNSDVDINSVDVYVKGDNLAGKKMWSGVVRFTSDLGTIKSQQSRTVSLKVLTAITEYVDESILENWLETKNKPKMSGLTIRPKILEIVSGSRTYKPNDSEPSYISGSTLPSDIDQFLTLIKYKR